MSRKTKQRETQSIHGATFDEWIQEQVESERYWFQRIRLSNELTTPGWSDPATEKLPYYGLPTSLEGLRVLDVGAAEGFFSFEAERRGAAEVVAIDSFPDSVRRFNISRAALGSQATAHLCSVYDLRSRSFGTYDLVLFYGVLYHLRHPLLALEKLLSVCSGTILVQTLVDDELRQMGPAARFYPQGIKSGPPEDPQFDPTVFWVPNRECVRAMMESAGFEEIEIVTDDPKLPFVLRARSPRQAKGEPPDQTKAPWS